MNTKIRWNNKDPATPALIDPLFDDTGIGPIDKRGPGSPEQKAEARDATKAFLIAQLKALDEVSMGDWEISAIDFYQGYLAGLNHNIHPKVW